MNSSRPAFTLEDLAKIAGVSRSTISRVINHEPNVRPEVRDHVWKIVEETGYHPNAAAKSLASKHSHTIGLVIPQEVSMVFGDPFFGSIIQGIAEAANEHQYHLMLSMLTQSVEEDFYRRALRGHRLDGVVLVAAQVDDPLVPRLHQDGMPFVVVGRYPNTVTTTYVDTDNARGAHLAVEHLIRQGRQRIATITGPRNMSVGQDRLEGYLAALRDAGFSADERLIAEGDFTQASGHVATHLLLPERPDAIFVASDLMATGALRALRDAGVSVPGDVAIVGFDDAAFASVTEPPLTTVRQPIYKLGTTAIQLLLEIMAEPDHDPRHMILPAELVIRESCGAKSRLSFA